MKQGTFDIINGTPIVFAYGLLKPDKEDYWWSHTNYSYHKDMKEYESSRKEWEVICINLTRDNYPLFFKWCGEYYLFKTCNVDNKEKVKRGQQVEFEEITPPTDKERGKCKILKIL